MTGRTPVALTIAGSDSGGGAGIQADLKTFAAFGVFGTCALTAVTAQNTRGVQAVHGVPTDIVMAQIAAVVADFDVRAIKIGMLATADIITSVAVTLDAAIPFVLDPVMVATSGDRLIAGDAVAALKALLIPRAACVTPNLHEAAALTGLALARDEAEMVEQGRTILALGCGSVLVKGGHSASADSVDLLVTAHGVRRYSAARVASENTHGTGCSLSAAIAAGLVRGQSLADAIEAAKVWLTGAIAAAKEQRLGSGHGPVAHFHDLTYPANRRPL